MDKTAIQAGKPPSANGQGTAIQASAPRPAPTARPAYVPKSLTMQIMVSVLKRLADLRITVTLFALSLFLVFYGTLAQMDKGVWTVVAEYFRSPLVWIPLKTVFFRAANIPGSIPYPGGWLLGGLLLVNLLAAHIVSFKPTWRRTGIWLIHSGIVLMMVGEVITGIFQVEGQMRITVGESTNYIEYPNAPELAVVDSSEVKVDHVTVIPTARLRRGGLISDAQLLFDVEVVRYMVNSDLADPRPGDANDANRGMGLRLIALDRPEGVGVDPDQKIDLASAYVTLKRKGTGESLGTYMMSVLLIEPERIEVDGKHYEVSLRFRRDKRPFAFQLEKLNVKFYQNTDVPKDYSSFIHLSDPDQKEERDIRIWMNHPFTYAGETFYQSGVHQDEMERWRMTTLQVVSNPGWMLPYLSCLLVACGMLFHFGLNLSRFIQRRAA
jgi:ResB-like family